MQNPLYHVLIDGRRLGPYDRRTIIGMRVKKMLDSAQVLVGADGQQCTVGDLVRGEAAAAAVVSSGTGRVGNSYSVVQGIHTARVLQVEAGGYVVPPFKGDVEVRVQTRALRVSGRYREGLGWKEERVKIPLQDIIHARLRSTVVDLWVRSEGSEALQRISLDLLERDAAGELAESLSHATPWPGSEPLAALPRLGATAAIPLLWTAIVGSGLLVGGVLLWALLQR